MINAIMSDNTFLLISTSFDGMIFYFVACQLNATTPFFDNTLFSRYKNHYVEFIVVILPQIVKHLVFIGKNICDLLYDRNHKPGARVMLKM